MPKPGDKVIRLRKRRGRWRVPKKKGDRRMLNLRATYRTWEGKDPETVTIIKHIQSASSDLGEWSDYFLAVKSDGVFFVDRISGFTYDGCIGWLEDAKPGQE